MKTILVALVVTLSVSACTTSGMKDKPIAPVGSSAPPQLWSDHKRMEMPLAVCAERAFNVLNALGYSDVVRNGNYSYGNFKENRAAVKCVESGAASFVYFAVAGSQRDVVENLRNQIARKM